jgi:hypothetical protein
MKKFATLLLIVGLMQMVGDVLHLPWLKGVGAATAISPAPKVFCAVRGLETYTTHFYVEWMDKDGTPRSLPLTSEVYSRLVGPYNRRNVYGAALAYGPVLATDARTKPMHEAVMKYALCDKSRLLQELGVDPDSVAGKVRVRLEPVHGTDMGELPRVLEAPCQ